MKDRDVGLWLIVGIAFTGLLFPVVGGMQSAAPDASPGGPASRAADGASAGESKTLSWGPLRCLGSFLGTRPGRSEGRDTWPHEGWRPEDPRRRTWIRFLIATVADPADSRFQYFFDRQLDAIQRAAEAAGYVLDRHDLPWPRVRPGPASGDAKPDARAYAREPGTLLFRRRTAGPEEVEALLCFLVGETPTSGVHKTALDNALQMIAWLSGQVENEVKPTAEMSERRAVSRRDALALARLLLPVPRGSPTVSILGPTFSGSTTSLEFVIRNWRARGGDWRLQLLSGSATALPKPTEEFPFQSTVAQDDKVLDQLFGHLRRRGIDPETESVLLVEANTAYGRSFGRHVTQKIPFPLHIADLRSEVEKERAERQDALITQSARILDTSLTLTQAGEERETVSPFSELHAPTAELVLENICSYLSQRRIRHVGILATDVRDLIFLARHLRRDLGDVALFTLSSDILYLHPDANRDLVGMLVATSYPVSCPVLPQEPDAGKLHFPMDFAQGLYNAALLLLRDQDADSPWNCRLQASLLAYRPKREDDETFGRPEATWITVVGKDACWPLERFPPAQVQKPIGDSEWPAMFLFGTAGCLALLLLLVLLTRWWHPELASSAGPVAFRDRATTSSAIQVRAILALLATVSLIPVVQNPYQVDAQTSFCLGTMWIVLLPVLFFAGAGPQSTILRSCPRRTPLLGASFVLAFGILAWLLSDWFRLGETKLPFLYQRAFAFRSGLSPLLPLLLVTLGIVAIGLSNLRRLSLARGWGEGTSSPGEPKPSSLFPVKEAQSRLLGCLRLSNFGQPGVLLILPLLTLIFLPIFGLVAAAKPISFEGPAFEATFAALFFFLAAAVGAEILRLVSIWKGLRALLQALARHPLARALASLKSQGPVLSLHRPYHLLRGLHEILGEGRRLAAALQEWKERRPEEVPEPGHPAWAKSFHHDLQAASESLMKADTAEAEGKRGEELRFSIEAHVKITEIVGCVAKSIEEPWRSGRTPEGEGALIGAASRLLARNAVLLIEHVLAQMKNLAGFTTAALLLMLFASSSYAFQPRSAFLFINWCIILPAVVVTVMVLIQMNRNSILSLLTNSTPWKITWSLDFLSRLFIYVGLPVSALLGIQFSGRLQDMVSRLLSFLGKGG